MPAPQAAAASELASAAGTRPAAAQLKQLLGCTRSELFCLPIEVVAGLGRVKTFSCKRSELEEVATRAVFPDFDYALIAAISG
jgi:hypothetical protein